MMDYLIQKVRTAIVDSERDRFNWFKHLLYLISIAYGGFVKSRRIVYNLRLMPSKKLPCAVISIGNIAVGGTGKTPMTIYVAELVQRLGYKVAVISRGYKGGAEKKGGVASDGKRICMDPETAGDEPYLMGNRLRDIPVIVGKNRFAAGMLAIQRFATDVVVLDDAFQHLQLQRDIDLVLIDYRRPFGNAHLLPRGPLREPICALSRSHAVILTRSDGLSATTFVKIKNMVSPRPVFKSVHVPNIYKVIKGQITLGAATRSRIEINRLKDFRSLAFSGIADNDDFRRTLSAMGCNLTNFFGYPDHYAYTDQDLLTISEVAENSGVDLIITTEKDFVKISHRIKLPLDLVVIGIQSSFGGEERAFEGFIGGCLSEIFKTERK